MKSRRLRAPREDSAVLAAPPLAEAPALLARNARSLETREFNFQGRSFEVLRAHARRELFEASSRFHVQIGADAQTATLDESVPLVLGGHQPELFHAGVWVKNFAVGAIARRVGATAAHLVVDNDLPKSVGIRVPTSDSARVKSVFAEFDDRQPEVPFEAWNCQNPELFRGFEGRVIRALQGAIREPIIEQHWPVARAHISQDANIGRALSAARRSCEQALGLTSREVPLSALCEGAAFRWFFAHILAHLDRFQTIHNACLERYRALNRIRSKNHPVAELASDGAWYEAPVWIWHVDQPRRRALFARQDGKFTELRVGRQGDTIASLRLTRDGEACCAVEDLQALSEAGWRIRTRAITTTMFARLLLADLFVHGIGGAKYDELGDEIAREFFGFAPPEFLTLSMTVWLGLQDHPATVQDLAAAEALLRDLTFNPDRHLPDPDGADARSLIEAKRAAIDRPVANRRQRVDRWRNIDSINRELQPLVRNARAQAEGLAESLRIALERNRVAHAREYAFVLHNGEHLSEAYRSALAPVADWRGA